jgi:hypothetical protein
MCVYSWEYKHSCGQSMLVVNDVLSMVKSQHYEILSCFFTKKRFSPLPPPPQLGNRFLINKLEPHLISLLSPEIFF